MKTLVVSFFSAANWFDSAAWNSLFACLNDMLGLTPRKYCEVETKWFPVASISDMTEQITSVNHCDWHYQKEFIWTVRFDGRQFVNLNLWKHESGMFNNCHFYLSATKTLHPNLLFRLRQFFKNSVGVLSAFYGSMELDSIIEGECSPCRGPWNLSFEFPTFRWTTFFSNKVISHFGKTRFDMLPCRKEVLDQGVLLDFGETPEEADLQRNYKLKAEELLGMNSFVIPAAFPQVNVNSGRFLRSMLTLDSKWCLPRMIGGGHKPEFTYVPTYETLAGEFQSLNSEPARNGPAPTRALPSRIATENPATTKTWEF